MSRALRQRARNRATTRPDVLPSARLPMEVFVMLSPRLLAFVPPPRPRRALFAACSTEKNHAQRRGPSLGYAAAEGPAHWCDLDPANGAC
jgi:hypothetical protein